MTTLRSISLNAVAVAVLGSAALLGSASAIAQTTPAPAVRIVSRIDEGQLVALKGNVNPHATAANDRGPVDAALPMADMMLVLGRSPEVQAAFDAYVGGQYDRTSPQYHQWLTPAQIGTRFGAAQSDIDAISAWLSSRGFTVTSVANDRMAIHFTGTAAQAESAFHVEIHNLAVGSESHIANMTDPQIPAAMAPVVMGVKGLQNFLPHPNHKVGSAVKFNQDAGKWQRVTAPAAVTATAGSEASVTKTAPAAKIRPQFGINECADPTANPCPTGESSLEEDLGPYDFATIYNVQPLWGTNFTGITGSGQTIAILGTSDLCLGQSASPCYSNNDVSAYRTAFGLPAGPSLIQITGVNGIDPGVCVNANNACNNGDLLENSLDVEMAGGVAPNAQIVLVTSGYNSQTNPSNDPLYADAEYVISNHGSQSLAVGSASILSLSYGVCELINGTTSNVAYYNLWQTAAAEGISVFVSTGDSGSPSCDDGEDALYGNPYSARYGINVNALASTPWNTAVGGTDFSWCQPTLNSSGNLQGCPTSTSAPGNYWNTSNNSSQGYGSAKGYVPEIPWNDTCTNPLLAAYIESLSSFLKITGVSTAEESCNFSANQNEYESIYSNYGLMLATFVDTIGGSGGASSCISNNSDQVSSSPTCNSGATSTGSLTLVNNGWPKPSWQTGVSGIPADGVRDIPDVSFFAGDGELDTATLVCSSVILGSSCSASSTNANMIEVGGTSVATPQMAGVMALINQKIGTPQGLANPELYRLGAAQTYSNCSAENVTTSSNCYFNDIDSGTIAMPCDLGAVEGGTVYSSSQGEYVPAATYAGINSPNCAALNSGDTVGTLVSSGTTPAYNAVTGYDLASGLGSLNIANVVNNWTADTGTGSATLTLAASPTSITINQSDTVTVTVSGGGGMPTGTVVLVGSNYTSGVVTLSGGVATISIPANILPAGADTLTAYYGGDSNYAAANKSMTLTVNVMTPTVTVSAPSADNVANPVIVTVTIIGPTGATAVPSGTVSVSSGGYSSSNLTLANGSATVLIPANSLAVGHDTLTATYSGDSNYALGITGTAAITIASTALLTPTVTVSPASISINSSQSLAVTVTVSGSGGTPTNSVSLTAGSYTSPLTTLTGGSATITIPSNTLATGSVTLTATYSGDSVYALKTGTATVNVNQSTVTLATPTNPATIAPGSSATVTINGSTSTTNYTGAVSVTSCTQTAGTSNTGGAINCTVSGTITYSNGTPTGSATATVTTTATHTSELVYPKLGDGKEWLGAGAGTVLAFVVFLGIPARRRSWRSMLGMIVLLVGLGSLAACGGGGAANSGGGSTTTPGTTAGTYTFTVTGTATPSVTTAPTASFTVTVN